MVRAGIGATRTARTSSPVQGLPSEGGERNAGEDNNDVYPLAVGSYPSVMSPWGLLDMAGGQSEFFETVPGSGDRYRRGVGGSDYNYTRYNDIFSPDIIGYYENTNALWIRGLRLVSPSPAPMDLNADGHVNFFDVSAYIRWYIEGDIAADLNNDGRLNIEDISLLLQLMQ